MTATASTIQFLSNWLYYDVNYRVYTDGILHQFELTQDAAVQSA